MHRQNQLTMLQNVNISENKGPKSSSKPPKVVLFDQKSGLVWFGFQHNGQTLKEVEQLIAWVWGKDLLLDWQCYKNVLENFYIYIYIVYILRRNVHKIIVLLGINQLKTVYDGLSLKSHRWAKVQIHSVCTWNAWNRIHQT